MKKAILPIACSLLLLTACGSPSAGNKPADNNPGSDSKKTVKIGITQIVEHPSLDAARKGFIAALKDAGYTDGNNLKLDVQFAQNDLTTNTTIAQKFVSDKDDLILAISTPSAQAAAKATKDIPILFTAITDPLGAKLVQSLDKPGGNVTGTSDTHPDAIKNTMKAIKSFFPNTKNVGIIYNSGEQNSVVNVKNAEKAMQELGLTPVEATITNSSEVKQAADSLVGRCEVLYIPKDNTVVSALESVIKVANDKHIPLFVGESDSVKRGGFAGYGFEYYDLGYQTGKMAVDILKNGKKPADIPVGFPSKLGLVINKKAAADEGITLTDAMTKDATIVGE
ncbi:ABC transporter substrate-binding protein [Effusibacillus dendaii]|uniref:ABC transporter substrate-binding protein n=1 Tax=Effusibacillus dendaii TaxID=2743772 RepID=A0A7I8DDN6_9BACL|nr:ABC transporter substrate-binding protein [Effusibacillus dendaii]BCJ88323.1 ABC transporter substrate-binding protein [Effusibacillus dendaii]